MIARSLLLSILLCSACFAFSQNSAKPFYYGENRWYPYYENGLTGWANPGTGGHIAPCSIKDIGFPFVYTPEEKMGLIDSTGKLLLDTAYYYLELLNDDHPVYSYNAVNDTLFTFQNSEGKGVISSSGRIIVESADRIEFHPPGLIISLNETYSEEKNENSQFYRIYDIARSRFFPDTYTNVNYSSFGLVVATPAPRKGSPQRSIVITGSGEKTQTLPYNAHQIRIWPYQDHCDDLSYGEYFVQILLTPTDAFVYHRNKLIDSIAIHSETISYDYYYTCVMNYPVKRSFPLIESVNTTIDGNIFQVETSAGITLYDLYSGDTLSHQDTLKFFQTEYYRVSAVSKTGKFGMYDGGYSIHANEYSAYDPKEGLIYPVIYDSAIIQEGNRSENYHTSYSGGRKVYFNPKTAHAIQDPETLKFAIADSTLKIVTPFEFDDIGWTYFLSGYETVVTKNSRKGLYDYQGRNIIPVEYDSVLPYMPSDQYATQTPVRYILKKDGETSFADAEGKILWKGNHPVINLISASERILIEFGDPDLRGVMDENNMIVVEPKYLKVDYAGRNFIVKTSGGTGIINSRQKKILSPDFMNIKALSENIYAVDDKNGTRIFNSAKRKFISPYLNEPDMDFVIEAPDTIRVRSEFNHDYHPYNTILFTAEGEMIEPWHNDRSGGVFSRKTDLAFYFSDQKGNRLTKMYHNIARYETLFSPEGPGYHKDTCRHFLLFNKDTLGVFDALSKRSVEKANATILLASDDSYGLKGAVLIGNEKGVELYSADLKKLSPVVFDSFDHYLFPLRYDPPFYFTEIEQIRLYSGKMRYVFDRRTGKLSEPVDITNDIYDINGDLKVEDYDSIEQIESIFKVTKGDKIYWFNEDRLLYYVSDVKPAR